MFSLYEIQLYTIPPAESTKNWHYRYHLFPFQPESISLYLALHMLFALLYLDYYLSALAQ